MGTFASIQTRVTRRLIDLPAAVLAEVPTFINEALVDIQLDHNFRTMEGGIVFITDRVQTNPALLGTIPVRFKELRGDPYYITSLGNQVRMKVSGKFVNMTPDFTLLDTGRPQILIVNSPENKIYTYPLPDGNSDYSGGEYRVAVSYWGYVAPLTGGTDTNWFTSNAERYLVEWATAQGFGLDWDEEHMAISLQKAEIERKKVILQDKRSRLAGVEEFAFHRDVYSTRNRN